MLKALYWRMFTLFRWLCLNTARFIQSPIYSLVKDLASIESDAELEATILDRAPAGLAANLASLEQHLKQYMPSMVGTFKPGDIRHLDTHRKKSFTRQ